MYKIKEFFKLFSRDMKRFFRRSQKRIAAMPQGKRTAVTVGIIAVPVVIVGAIVAAVLLGNGGSGGFADIFSNSSNVSTAVDLGTIQTDTPLISGLRYDPFVESMLWLDGDNAAEHGEGALDCIGTLSIPSLGVNLPIADNAGSHELTYAVGRYSKSAKIDSSGVTALVCLKGPTPGKLFHDIATLESGASVIVKSSRTVYTYAVESSYTVAADDIKSEISATKKSTPLVLVTYESEGLARFVKCRLVEKQERQDDRLSGAQSVDSRPNSTNSGSSNKPSNTSGGSLYDKPVPTVTPYVAPTNSAGHGGHGTPGGRVDLGAPTPTPRPTTPKPTLNPSPSSSASPSPTPTPSATPSPSPTPSATPSPSPTPTPSSDPSPTQEPAPSPTESIDPTDDPSPDPTNEP